MASNYPINIDIIRKDSEIPNIIAKLSYIDEKEAIKFIRQYGEMTKPITPLHDDILRALANKEID